MSYWSRLRTLAIANLASKRGETHEARLNAYYRHQADAYDEFREHLLHGRRPLLSRLPDLAGARVVELGAGTGWNAEALGERLAACESYTMVELCEPLRAVAAKRVERMGCNHVQLVRGDAREYRPDKVVDVVLCSYVLTMMANWFEVVDRAWEMLRPGGVIGATDFYVSGRERVSGARYHSSASRWFWKACFAQHHVYLNEDHLPYLRHRFSPLEVLEERGRMPFMAGLRAPYYVFVGRKEAGKEYETIDRG